jgi:orotate phosphoribosyltransferase
VASALVAAGGLRFNAAEPFILASRKIAPIYVDVRQLTAEPTGWRTTVRELAELVRKSGRFDFVSGGELADLFFSVPVALELGLPHVAIRKQTKGYGTGGRLVGSVRPGAAFAHVSDLITAGTSAQDWVKAIRDAGGVVQHYFVVFDRRQGGRQALEAAGVTVHSLLELSEEFLSFVSERAGLSGSQLGEVRRYLGDPERWSRDFLRRNPSFLRDRIEASGGKLTRSEGLEVLNQGYPDLMGDVGGYLRKRLKELGLDETLVGPKTP